MKDQNLSKLREEAKHILYDTSTKAEALIRELTRLKEQADRLDGQVWKESQQEKQIEANIAKLGATICNRFAKEIDGTGAVHGRRRILDWADKLHRAATVLEKIGGKEEEY